LLRNLISSSKKEVLSYNTSGIFVPLGENKITGKAGENLTLIKGQKMDMGRYWVSFDGKYKDKLRNDKWYYRLNFETKDGRKINRRWSSARDEDLINPLNYS